MEETDLPSKRPKLAEEDNDSTLADDNNSNGLGSKEKSSCTSTHEKNPGDVEESDNKKSITKNDEHNRCKFFIEKKKRCCKTQPPKGQEYCVEHAHNLGQSTIKKRVSCPLDPKHSCYEDQLQKHLKKCNARPELQPPYYTRDINAGEEEGEDPSKYKIGLRDVPEDEIFQLIEKVKQYHKEQVGELETNIQFHSVLQGEADKPSNGLSAQKHIQQQASLIGHMERLHLLASNTSFVEFGAGKGGLSHWVQLATQEQSNTQFLLVDKGSVRYKLDNYHKGADQGPSFERIKLDIADLDLGKLKSLCERDTNVVGMGKHLCGGATDLMLRCLVETFIKSTQKRSHLQGVVLAFCCHHRCDWKTYVGKAFMRGELGLSARQFQLLTRLTSWAVCGTRPTGKQQMDNTSGKPETSSEEEEHDHNVKEYNHPRYGYLVPEERAEIGYQCKQLIDAGRRHYLQKHGLDVQIVYYVERERTLENMALLASLSKDS